MLKLKLRYLATWCEELTYLKRPWCWERLKAGGERDDREWDGWVASPTQQTWVWVNSRSYQWTGRPGMLQSMWLQRVGRDWATELNWIVSNVSVKYRAKSLAESEDVGGGIGSSRREKEWNRPGVSNLFVKDMIVNIFKLTWLEGLCHNHSHLPLQGEGS